MLFKEREVMPAVKKVSREEIIDAAVDVLVTEDFLLSMQEASRKSSVVPLSLFIFRLRIWMN